jgi:signal recognition particle subunit SRP72
LDAAALYHDLASQQAGLHGEENDIKINLLATNTQLEWAGLGHRINDSERQSSRADLEAFETAYNAACAHIARAELAKASVLLKRARDLCEANDDLSADEKKTELLPIMVQHIYVLSQLGKDSEAAALQKLVVQSEYVPIWPLPSDHYLIVSVEYQKHPRGQSPRTIGLP